jgi:membrane-anchored protein YejM (alkaline phosphatase superfamily)
MGSNKGSVFLALMVGAIVAVVLLPPFAMIVWQKLRHLRHRRRHHRRKH